MRRLHRRMNRGALARQKRTNSRKHELTKVFFTTEKLRRRAVNSQLEIFDVEPQASLDALRGPGVTRRDAESIPAFAAEVLARAFHHRIPVPLSTIGREDSDQIGERSA